MSELRLTIPERILLAADRLQLGSKSFTAEDLIVRAWKLSPTFFGLQGYSSVYPDSNRVLTKIMGRGSALRKNGWLEKVGTKKYRLTAVGRLKAKELARRAPDDRRERLSQSRQFTAVLRRLLASNALEKFPHQRDDLTFSDLCSFWNISPRSTAHQLSVREAEVREAIHSAQEAAPVLLPDGDEIVTPETLDLLRETQDHLLGRFRTELDVIRGRSDERRL